ncbi:hypothetical protein GQG97_003199 [Salmonella enterica]|nr:hypothetical protein [Salmonella enterica]
MSDEPGRGKFVVQAAEARSSVWRRTAGRIRDEILHSRGLTVNDVKNHVSNAIHC